MKRYPIVVGVTAAGLAGVLTFHSQRPTLPLTDGRSSSASAPSGDRPAETPGPGTPTSNNPPSQGPTSTSATGAAYQYGYGQLSVRVTMTGGRITNISIAALQTADTYSQQLADQVVPTLEREVVSAQSARIDAVSGATYTSEAYAYSVQSALDKLAK